MGGRLLVPALVKLPLLAPVLVELLQLAPVLMKLLRLARRRLSQLWSQLLEQQDDLFWRCQA